MKLLFLDVDGVLNSIRSAIAYDGYPYPGREALDDRFDDVAVFLIKQVCIKTNSLIVLSSTWRYGVEPLAFGQRLKLPIIDKTPRGVFAPEVKTKRGLEIEAYLKKAKEVEKFAIVDDDSDMLDAQLPFFIKVDNRNGLSYENYLALLKLLE